jgi:hypothetical protein
MPSYNLSNIEELVQFDSDCCDAVHQCPQSLHTEPILSYPGPHSIAGTFQSWFYRDTLWKSGYSECLSKKAKDTFRRYASFADGRVIDAETNNIFDPKDTFRVRTKHIATT